jgi:hypothetical protein
MQRSILLFVAASLFTAPSLAAQPPSRNASRERRIEEALALVSVGAVPALRRATQRMDAGNYAEAEPLFREVLASAGGWIESRFGGRVI